MDITAAWLIAGIALFAVEAVTVGLLSIWFGIGAIAAMICSLYTGNAYVQLIVFAVVSLASLAIIRPIAQKALKKSVQPTYGPSVVTKQVVFVSDTDNEGIGRVKLGDVCWNAVIKDGGKAVKGDMARVVAVDGNKLIVEKE